MTLSWGDLAPFPSSAADLPAADALQTRLAALALAVARRADLWRPVVRHDPVLRWHARLANLGDVEIWLLGWTHEQEVEMHDHGGSSGAFAVAEGELGETWTVRGDRAPLRTAFCPAGIARAFGPERIHHVTNPGGANATSVHVYSPPLSSMSFYDIAPDRAPEVVRVEHIIDDHDDVARPSANGAPGTGEES